MTDADDRVHDLPTLRATQRGAISVQEAADVIGVDHRTVRKAIEAGQLPSIELGRRILVPSRPLLKLLVGDSDSDG